MLAMNTELLPKIKLMGFVSYTQPWVHFRRTTSEHILYVVKSGELHLREGGVSYNLTKGDFLFLEPNVEHVGTEKHVCDYYYIHFEHPDLKSVQVDDLPALSRSLMVKEGTEPAIQDPPLCYFPKTYRLPKKNLPLSFHALNEMLQLYRRHYFNRSLSALKLTEWLIEVSREYFIDALQSEETGRSRSVMKVHALLGYIHGHYADKITSRDIEREFGGNYDYINRVFTRMTGQSIMRYVNQVRINHAKELIEATHLSFGEIGYLCGLEDPFYFSKVFKKYAGVSPSQYDKRVRGREGVNHK
ncbi:helix-turn-helix transcriptional regulator [Paenibacillus faecis]|uniref:Helix-turn-helix transcriptional regulator n=1 Tax=Paenibacillus faecis TaxID=862114 RepID=A0A5D0CNY4_9BACL|nr:AraC family transcriptional regulator [Paenibacillus faecis]TYA10367.1 helix-turn-helix transcriptional regulator [Paenibacillus faecis]